MKGSNEKMVSSGPLLETFILDACCSYHTIGTPYWTGVRSLLTAVAPSDCFFSY